MSIWDWLPKRITIVRATMNEVATWLELEWKSSKSPVSDWRGEERSATVALEKEMRINWSMELLMLDGVPATPMKRLLPPKPVYLLKWRLIKMGDDKIKVIGRCVDYPQVIEYFERVWARLEREFEGGGVTLITPPTVQEAEGGVNAILPAELEVGGKYGTCRDLTLDDVRAIVGCFYKFKDKGGKLPDFYEQLNITPGEPRSFELETLRGWAKDPKFIPKDT